MKKHPVTMWGFESNENKTILQNMQHSAMIVYDTLCEDVKEGTLYIEADNRNRLTVTTVLGESLPDLIIPFEKLFDINTEPNGDKGERYYEVIEMAVKKLNRMLKDRK